MRIRGKIFGTGAGLLFGGLPGAIIGGILGHFIDSISVDNKNVELERLKEKTYWAAKVSAIDGRFLFSKRDYFENYMIKSNGISSEEREALLKSFDRYVKNGDVKIISVNSENFVSERYEFFKQLYNLSSIGGIDKKKRESMELISRKFKISSKEFNNIDKEFTDKLESYDNDVKHAIDVLRLPVFFNYDNVKRQSQILKKDFLQLKNSDSENRIREVNEASVKLNNYLKEV